MNPDDLYLVSVDDHVIEPADVFVDRVEAKYADAAPRMVVRDDGTYVWRYAGTEKTNPAVQAVVGRPKSEWGMTPMCLEEMRPGCYDVHARVKDMDANGVLGSMCFPSFVGFAGRLFVGTADVDQSAAMVRAYNDWHIDAWAGAYPGRFIPLAIPVLADPEAAAAEVRRVAAKGCHALTFVSMPHDLGLPTLYSDHWDPLWKACVDEGTVVCIHISSNGLAPSTSPDAPIEVQYSLAGGDALDVAADLVWSRLFLRFPDLRVALSEGGIGWIPYFLERIDYLYEHSQHWSGTDLQGHRPSELFLEHVITCFIADRLGVEARHHLNLDNITWECDYPHSDTTWPTSPESVVEHLAALPDDERDRITHLNAMRHFRYDPFAHLPREQARAGALRRRAADWDVQPRPTAHLRPTVTA